MPIYEYECRDCLARHEFIQKFSDPPKGSCPDCGGNLRKLISMNAFHLKGGGWYADGYSSAQPEKDNKEKSATVEKKSPPGQPATNSGTSSAPAS